MEDKELNEKESLELITRMIQNSRKNLQMAGFGNQFLLWGYLCTVVPLAIFVMLTVTRNQDWNYLFLLIPGVGFPVLARQNLKRDRALVKTYTDNVLDKIWRVLFGAGVATATFVSVYFGNLAVMLPIVLICCAIGTAITGEILKNKWMSNAGLWSFCLGVCILAKPTASPEGWYPQYLIFAICFVCMFVIPGHRLNREAKGNV